MVELTIYFLVLNFTLLQNFGNDFLQIQWFFKINHQNFQKKSSMVQVGS